MNNSIHPCWVSLVVALWLLPVLSVAAQGLAKSIVEFWRSRRVEAALFFVAVLWVASWAFPSSAEKGGTPVQTNAAPSATGSIRLYYTDSNGRLVPLGAAIRGDK